MSSQPSARVQSSVPSAEQKARGANRSTKVAGKLKILPDQPEPYVADKPTTLPPPPKVSEAEGSGATGDSDEDEADDEDDTEDAKVRVNISEAAFTLAERECYLVLQPNRFDS